MGGSAVPVSCGGYRDDVVCAEREVNDVLGGKLAEQRDLIGDVAAALQAGDEVEQTEGQDTGLPVLLPQRDVIAPSRRPSARPSKLARTGQDRAASVRSR